jgi:hypothetical protein
MRHFIKCLRPESAEHWLCIKACGIELPGGRIQVAPETRFTTGTRFMDLDIADFWTTSTRKPNEAAALIRRLSVGTSEL